MFDENNRNWYRRGCKFVSKSFQARIDNFKAPANSRASSELKKALKFTNLSLEPYEVFLFSYFVGLTSSIGLVLAWIAVWFFFSVDWLILTILPLSFLIPVFLTVYLTNYPTYYCNKLKIKTLGKLPEAINYLGVAMKLSPCLDSAVKLAAENLDEALSSELKRMLWNVSIRKYSTFEEALTDFANDWGEWNEDFKQALYAIRSSCLETSEEGREHCIEKASNIIIAGIKARIDGFVSSLTLPTMVLFSLGILLPMMIGAMLPMLSMGLQLGTLEFITIIIFIFPLTTFLYSYSTLGKRPGTVAPPTIPSKLTKRNKLVIIGVALALAIGISLPGFVLPSLFQIQISSSIFIILGLGLGIGYYCKAMVRDQTKERAKIKKLEAQLPDALFLLGSRVAENEPLETALHHTGKLMKNTPSSELFSKISKAIRLRREALDKLLFGSRGILERHPSRAVKAVFRTVVESTKRDNSFAGKLLVKISNWLRDLKRAENDIRNKLGSVLSMMLSTAALFAPLILGITCALYSSLSNALASIRLEEGIGEFALSSSTTISPALFSLIMGLYLILLVLIIVYFCSGILHDADPIERSHQIGKILPSAVLVFALSVILGQWLIRV